MEIFKFLPNEEKTLIIKVIHLSDLVELEKLVSWLDGFTASHSGRISGHFELVMLLRQLEEVSNGKKAR